MASDRTLYDMGAYNVKTSDSTKPMSYMMAINANENCMVCGDKPNVSVHADRVNLENDILGLTRKLTKDPKEKYQFNPKIADTLNYSPPYLCERDITDASFINPINNTKYMETLKSTPIQNLKSLFSA